MRALGFIGPSYVSRSINFDCQRCINLYPEIDEIGTGKEREIAALVSTPGLNLLTTLAASPNRGMFTASNGSLYVVNGNKLYYLDSSFVATELGTLTTYFGQVSMADNGIQLVVVDGPNGYVVTLATSAFATITDPAFLGADQVTFQDGYFIFNKPSSGEFYISALNGVTFNGLDIATSEGNPDNIIGLVSVHRDLWIFNARTTEVFFDSGANAFPFERIQGAFIEVGCIAKFSIAKISNTVLWLGQDEHGSGIVFMAQGYQPLRISTHAVEEALRSYGSLDTCVAYTYQEDGHFFYCMNFSNADTTWVYDVTTKLWHERAYTNQGQLERHRANSHAFAYGKHIVGDYENGNIYEQSIAYYSDNGAEITRRRTAPHMTDGLRRLFYASFQLDLETGTGLDGITQGTDPQAMLKFSDDGGHTWSNEKWASIGKIGQTKARALWRRLGASRDRVFQINITDPVKIILLGAEIAVVEGES